METVLRDTRWKDLYRLAGVAAVVSFFVIIMGLVTYFFWPYAPGSKPVEAIFQSLQSNPLGGMISLDLFLFLGNLFSILLYLALYVALREVNESYALIALALGLIAVTLLIPARPVLEAFALSRAYSGATGEAARSQIAGAGQAIFAQFDGINWFMNTLLGGISLLISSLLMLRSKLFTRTMAWVGIATNAIVCLFFIPVVGKFLLFLCLPGYMIWYFLLARRFFHLARSTAE